MTDASSTKHRSHWVRNTLIVVGVLAIIAVAVAGTYAFTLSRTFNDNRETIEEVFPDETSRPPATATEGSGAAAQNILLLGSDLRGEIDDDIDALRGQRSDTIMVLHLPADRKHAYVMSIMRDSWVEIPGKGSAKVNAALSFGGVPLVVQTVESLISTRIDHVAIIDFEGFKGLTDALGGVEVDNPIPFSPKNLKGAYFPQGKVTLNGEQALAFVRERYAFADGDFQRARNQQIYLKAVMGTLLSRNTLTDPGKIGAAVSAISPYLKVDKALDSAYVAGLGLELRSLRTDDITFFTAPTAGTGTSPDGQSIVKLDMDELAVVQEGFRNDTLQNYSPSVQTMN